MLTWPSKDPSEVLDYRWDVPLDDSETVSSATATRITGDINLDQQQADIDGLTVWLSGGAAGTSVFRLYALTSENRVYEDFISVSVVVAAEPLSVSELKQHLDIQRDDQDDLLAQTIVAGREWVENYTGLVLTPREVAQGFDRFCNRIELHAWPIRGVPTVSYSGTDGTDISVADVRIVASQRPARVLPAFNTSWPSSADAITVTVPAGYANPAYVPATLKAAITIYAASYYETRQISDATVLAMEALCHAYRLPGVA